MPLYFNRLALKRYRQQTGSERTKLGTFVGAGLLMLVGVLFLNSLAHIVREPLAWKFLTAIVATLLFATAAFVRLLTAVIGHTDDA